MPHPHRLSKQYLHTIHTVSTQYLHTMYRISTHYLHRCHPWTGQCLCKPGYSGAHCHRPCPVYTYGPGCEQVKYFYVVTNIFAVLNTENLQVCSCENFAHCDPRDGACLCSPGWLGPRCEKPCRSGKQAVANMFPKYFQNIISRQVWCGVSVRLQVPEWCHVRAHVGEMRVSTRSRASHVAKIFL